jgi:hypothetical protein
MKRTLRALNQVSTSLRATYNDAPYPYLPQNHTTLTTSITTPVALPQLILVSNPPPSSSLRRSLPQLVPPFNTYHRLKHRRQCRRVLEAQHQTPSAAETMEHHHSSRLAGCECHCNNPDSSSRTHGYQTSPIWVGPGFTAGKAEVTLADRRASSAFSHSYPPPI